MRECRPLCVLRSATVMFCEEALFSHFIFLFLLVVLRNVVLGSLCLLNLQPPERGLGLLGLVRPLNILPGNDRRYSGASIHNPARPTVASREHRKESKVLCSACLCCAPLMHWHAGSIWAHISADQAPLPDISKPGCEESARPPAIILQTLDLVDRLFLG